MMDYIEQISNQYGGEILLHDPYTGDKHENISQEIYSFLQISNGISETMRLPNKKEKIEIVWLIYSHDMILEWTSFYDTNYGLKGTVFSDDGGDCVYCIKPDGAITCFNSMDNDETQIADTLWDFFNNNFPLSERS